MTLRNLLRDKTAASHQQLDDMVAKMNVFESERSYHAYLIGMYQLYAIYGNAVDRASELAGLTPSVSSLMDAIAFDCELSKADLEREFSATQFSADATNTDDVAACWAVGYVLEGSAMGARYMVKSAKKLVDRTATERVSESPCEISTISARGTSYLTSLSADSYERWPKFVEAMNSASKECDEKTAIDAATGVFETAKRIYSRLATELSTEI